MDEPDTRPRPDPAKVREFFRDVESMCHAFLNGLAPGLSRRPEAIEEMLARTARRATAVPLDAPGESRAILDFWIAAAADQLREIIETAQMIRGRVSAKRARTPWDHLDGFVQVMHHLMTTMGGMRLLEMAERDHGSVEIADEADQILQALAMVCGLDLDATEILDEPPPEGCDLVTYSLRIDPDDGSISAAAAHPDFIAMYLLDQPEQDPDPGL